MAVSGCAARPGHRHRLLAAPVEQEQTRAEAALRHSGLSGRRRSDVLGCLDRPTAGRYVLEGADTARLTEPELARIRSNRIGFVFQSFNLQAFGQVADTLRALQHDADELAAQRAARRKARSRCCRKAIASERPASSMSCWRNVCMPRHVSVMRARKASVMWIRRIGSPPWAARRKRGFRSRTTDNRTRGQTARRSHLHTVTTIFPNCSFDSRKR